MVVLFNLMLSLFFNYWILQQPNGNQTDDGLYTIYTGQDKLDHFAKIASWNNKK